MSMAKMFYTLDEAAEKLGVSVDQVREMANSGKLQQFRDRDKLMFKREHIDALMNNEDSTSGISLSDDSLSGTSLAGDSLGGTNLAGDSLLDGSSLMGSSIPLKDSNDTDTIELKLDDSQAGAPAVAPKQDDPRERTGISVFDAGEVEPVDPAAQTVVTNSVGADEELALESVGSGSGLLDLTRESDDTSLGAELLDEIYPGGSEGSDAKIETSTGSSGVFDGAATIEPTASGLENIQQSGAAAMAGAATYVEVPVSEPSDPSGSGLTLGGMLAAAVSMVLVLIIIVSAMGGVSNQITELFRSSLWVYSGILLGVSIVFLVVGFFVGKTQER
jgi:excisionase family DNA binding protein